MRLTHFLLLSLAGAQRDPGDALATTGWVPDNRVRADGTLGPRSSARGFRLPKQGTFGWHKHAVLHVQVACLEKRTALHADCGAADMYQFGVYTGRSLKGTTRALRARHVPFRAFWGLDSFQGLPDEDASEARSSHSGAEWQRGTFNAADMFKTHSYAALIEKIRAYVDEPRARFVRGYYNESCTPDLAKQMRPALFVDVDVDLYISTVQALSFMLENGLLVAGSLVGYDDWPAGGRRGGEQRAHRELTRKFGLKWKNIVPGCKESTRMQCVFELLAVRHPDPDCDCL